MLFLDGPITGRKSGKVGLNPNHSSPCSFNCGKSSLAQLTIYWILFFDIGLSNYSSVRVTAGTNEIYQTTSNNTEQSFSVIGGPRANFGAIAPIVMSGLDAEYTLYGSTGVSISGLSGTYDIIDTIIYVQGSIVTLQIPFRIIRIRT